MKYNHLLHLHRGEIFGFVINDKYRGKEIGRSLIDAIIKRAIKMGLSILELSCRAGTPAEKVYLKLGFIEFGRLPRGIIEP